MLPASVGPSLTAARCRAGPPGEVEDVPDRVRRDPVSGGQVHDGRADSLGDLVAMVKAREAQGWTLWTGAPESPTARVRLREDDARKLLFNALY